MQFDVNGENIKGNLKLKRGTAKKDILSGFRASYKKRKTIQPEFIAQFTTFSHPSLIYMSGWICKFTSTFVYSLYILYVHTMFQSRLEKLRKECTCWFCFLPAKYYKISNLFSTPTKFCFPMYTGQC